MWEDAHVWEDNVCGFVLSPSLAFDKEGKREDYVTEYWEGVAVIWNLADLVSHLLSQT